MDLYKNIHAHLVKTILVLITYNYKGGGICVYETLLVIDNIILSWNSLLLTEELGLLSMDDTDM